MKAVILLSGGMDSAICIALAIEQGFEPYLFHMSYGQRTEKRELKSVINLAKHYGLNHPERVLIVTDRTISYIGGNAITDRNIPVPTDGEIIGVPATFVPFRNAILLSYAVTWAQVIEAEAIYFGVVDGERSRYPDCHKEFIESYQLAVDAGIPDNRIQIITPLYYDTKREAYECALRLNVPLELTWSCYQNENEPCGKCESCMARAKAMDL